MPAVRADTLAAVNPELLFGLLVVAPMVAVAAMIAVDRRKD